jgi:hypothetical protein
MPKLAQPISNNYSFNVELEPLFTQEGKRGGYGTVRKDTGDVLGVFSERYSVVQNDEAVKIVEEAFETHGMSHYKKTPRVTRNGSAMFISYDFTDIKHIHEVPKVGDKLGISLLLKNSFDGSQKLSFELGFIRLVCSNGMKSLEREYSFFKRHIGKLQLGHVSEALNKAMCGISDSLGIFSQMADVSITEDQGVSVLRNMSRNGIFSEKVREGVEGIWLSPDFREDRAKTLYNLYNAGTQYISHRLTSDRYEMAQRLSSVISSQFARLAKSPAELGKMLVFSNN